VTARSGTAGPSSDLLRAVQQRYGLDGLIGARRLTGGYANDVFLLEADPPIVLHVKPPPADAESLAWEHRLLRHLAELLQEVPAPLTARDGLTFFWHEGQPAWLTPYMAGSPAEPADRRAVAAALGRLHAVKIDIPVRPGHHRIRELPVPPVRAMPPDFEPWLPLVAHARTEMIRLISQIDRSRTVVTGVTHNDIFPGNVLVHDGRVTALLDWEEADIDWLVWDLACGIWPFCDAEDDVRAAVSECLVAYRDAGGLVPPAEDDLIIPLIRAKRILEVLRAPTDRHPRWDLQLANLRAYQRLF
jgi:Ser/Thr protein kinase RdoA (MazF antagonist)